MISLLSFRRPLRRVGRVLAPVLVLLPALAGAPAPEGWQEAPLAARSGPRGGTLFTRLPAEQTGLVTENQFADPNMWGRHYMEFTLGAMGTGVAIGDYDNDGRPDVFVVSKTETSRLFRNLGAWKFEDVTERAGLGQSGGWWSDAVGWAKEKLGHESGADGGVGAWKQGAAFADVNNDGRLDLYVCRFNAPNLLYVNQGDGTFREEAAARGLAVVDACGMGAFCDYDRDGWLDVYIQTNMLDAVAHPNGQRGYLLRNRGNGTFEDVSAAAGITGETLSHSATWWDYDHDGWPDLYVANDFAAADKLYRNQRDGTFKDVVNQVVPHMPYSSMGADLGDVNNDGRIDLLVADMAASTHEMDQRGMATSRSMNNQDAGAAGAAPQYVRNALYLNTGVGRCLEAAFLAGLQATDWTWSVRFEDLDNDGRLDLHVTNGMSREFHNSDLRDRMVGAASPEERTRLVRVGAVMPETHRVYRNLGDLRFEDVSGAWGLDEKGVSFGAAFGDLDGDGDLDLVYANYQAGVSVFRNDADTGHRLVVALRGTRSNRFGVGATVRVESKSGVQVRSLVLARGYLSSSEPVLHFGLGDDERIDRLTVSWPAGGTQTYTALAVDRRITLTETQRQPGAAPATTSVAPLFAESTDALGLAIPSRLASVEEPAPALLPVRQNRRGPALAVGDLNGDGIKEVLVGGTTRDPLAIAAPAADGRYRVERGATLRTAPTLDDGPLLIFDANQDGAADVLVTQAGTRLPAGAAGYQPMLFLGDGRGGFAVADEALPELPVSVGAIAAADFDRDGRLDVFVGGRVVPGKYPLPARSALLLNRGGRFEDVTAAQAPGLREPGLVTAALWTDVDEDGWPDLLVALEWGGVVCWRNEAGRGFTDASARLGFAAAGAGWWSSLAAGDFNGDGRIDYAAGNLGLNTPYHATAERPALLFAGEFASGARMQLVEAYYEGDRLFPWRTRKDLGAKIPSVLRRFPRNDAYAAATLPEILGPDRLAAARRFAATEFRSGVFLSQLDGTYRFEPLPRLAQIAPAQGMVVADFDGDGRMDLCLAQNSHAPIPPVGHFDGGLGQLLRGDGTGRFAPVAPEQSGIVVPGDAEALVLTDLDRDGAPDLLVSRNSDSTLAFRHCGAAGVRFVRVTLRGPSGNPEAVGARVLAERADGARFACEVQAGGGYYSQSTAAVFLGVTEANPLRRVSVRWPSGATTEHTIPAGASTVTFAAPR